MKIQTTIFQKSHSEMILVQNSSASTVHREAQGEHVRDTFWLRATLQPPSERSETEENMWLWKIKLWECCYSNLSTIWIQRSVSDIFQPISEIWHFSHQMCIFWEFESFREGFFFCLTSAFLEAGFDDQATSFHQTLPTPALVWNVFLKHCKNCKCCPGQVTNIVMSSQL